MHVHSEYDMPSGLRNAFGQLCGNELLALLDGDQLRRCLASSKVRSFTSGQDLTDFDPNGQLAFFIESGLVFEIEQLLDREIATRCIGLEGVSACSLFRGKSNQRSLCVSNVEAVCVPRDVFVQLTAESPSFNRTISRYLQRVFTEMAECLLTTAHLTVEQRLARLLDLSFQRAKTDTLAMSHVQLASLLGVRRAGITVALHLLEGELAIRSHRCRIQLRDGNRLRELWRGEDAAATSLKALQPEADHEFMRTEDTGTRRSVRALDFEE
ncbi:Crp/Fnr family transcriptional regulator [Flaviflagellibacter deserti]|uniref:Crp/Fnr family transcriptional regulator n=1 Tax=Flaviflagellibacter deserti TaxID=2267266 RepID=A0ABV9Z0R6_9HYPH